MNIHFKTEARHEPLERPGWRARSKLAFITLLGLCASGWLAMPVDAKIWVWDTAGPDSLWSNPNNWFDYFTGARGAPQNGDNLLFIDNGIFSGPGPMMNDLTNLAVNSMNFDVTDLVLVDWVLNGNPVIISNTTAPPLGGQAIENSRSGNSYVHINCGLKLATGASFATGAVGIDGAGTVVPMDLNGPIDLNGHTLTLGARTADYPGTVEGPSVGHLYVAGEISGNGNVNVVADSQSLVIFTSQSGNSFHGTLTANAALGGAIRFNSAPGDVVTDALLINNVGAVELLLPNQISDGATVTIIAGATLSMNGHNDTIGSLSLVNVSSDALPSTLDTGSGTLTVNGNIASTCNNNDHTPTIKGRLNLASGSHNITTSGSAYAGLDMQAQVIGFGGFHKLGTSALLLEASNTFSGSISIDNGILDVRNNHALGDVAGDTSLFGGQLTLRNVNIGTERLSAEGQGFGGEMPGSLLFTVGSCSWAGQVLLDTNLVVTGGDMTFTGDISGTGGIGFFNLGTSVLGGSLGNLYTGTTLVRCPLLEFNKPSGINAYAGPLVVGGGFGGPHEARWLNSYQNVGATLTLYDDGIVNLNNHNEDFGPVTFNGGTVDSGPSGQFAIYAPLTVNPAPTSAVINGYLGLPPGANRVFVVGDGAADCDLLVNAVVFGSPGTYIVKQGAGTMCLANVNTYDAPTLLEEGILDISNGSSLGTWPGLVIFDGATLRVSGAGTGGGFEAIGAGVGGTHGAVEILPNASFTFAGGMLLDGPTTFNVGQSGGLALNGAISSFGPGCSVIKTGIGTLIFGGAANNTYSGDTTVSAGGIYLGKSANYISVPGNLIIGPATGPTAFARLGQVGGLGGTTVTVNANSLFDLFGYYQSLTTLNLRDGGSVHTGVGLLDFPSGGAINVGSLNAFGSHASAAITGAIGLPLNATLSFNINAFAPSFPFASGPELDVPAAIPRPPENLGFAPAGITKNGLGQMRLGGNNTYAGSTFINGGTLSVDGTQPQSPVLVNSGTLGGSGTVGPIYMSGGVVAPGDGGPGILTCSNLNEGITASGVLRMELNGTTPGSGYDQLNVRGTVNLAGVTLQPLLGFSAPTGAQFDMISNDGSDAVTGTFNGLADSGKLYIGGVLYQINYRFGGRPGNDVALQGLDTPPPPVLTIQSLPPASVLLLWATNDPPFTLQACTNLTAPNWLPALPQPVVIGTNNVVTNAVDNLERLYRLSNP